ncbi:hypothetical protein [Oerskovia flava]|uniref:hypothetical protein n=1 Tax=Oerskovia flava TaxID=2986422 RepID=UPI00223F2F93|nr:hypothetical protein [Oerskovia sp. JB1-3-2]
MITASSRPRALVVTAIAALLALAPGSAHAATDDETEPAGSVTWSVVPADADGPDGRRWLELTLDPGDRVTEHLAVRNLGDVESTFALQAADGYLTDKGRFNMLPSSEPSVDGGTWIDLQDEVVVGAGETVVVPFTIVVPEQVTPGDHPAGVAASVTSTSDSVGVESRVGFRVMMRVTGEVSAVLAVPQPRASYSPSWNPFAPGDLRVSYDVSNDGNIRLGAQSEATATGPFGLAPRTSTATPVEEVLPGGSYAVTTEITDVWPLGRVTTDVTLTPVPVGEDELETTPAPVTQQVVTWAIPWPQLLLVAIVVVLVLGVRDERRRKRARLQQMLDRARDEGRQAALTPETGAPAPTPRAD